MSFDHGTPSRVYLDARAEARHMSLDALQAQAGTYASIVDDPGADPVERFNAAERRRAYSEEIDHRERVAAKVGDSAMEIDPHREGWKALAEIVKERTSVPEILQFGGIAATRTGRNRRHGANEYHSACPACGDGVDRLVSWDGPNGRVWCRRCEWSADAIGVTRSVIPGCTHFRDAVRFLADLAGMAVDDGR